MSGSERLDNTPRPPSFPERLYREARRSIGLPTQEDKAWSKYMSKRRDWRENLALLDAPKILPEFHYRVLEIFLVPDITALPYPVNQDSYSRNNLFLNIDWRNKLKDDQPMVAAQIVGNLMQDLDGREDDKSLEAMAKYNSLVITLLPMLPDEEAEKIFTNFHLNDIFPYSTIDYASGYNPLEQLYRDGKIEEVWKRKAADIMHKVIEGELSGQLKPRRDWEVAERRYRSIVEGLLYSLPVSKSFFGQEMQYLLDLNLNHPIVCNWNVSKALDILEDVEIRYSFVRKQILSDDQDNHDKFLIYNSNLEDTARKILEEYPEDLELQDYLRIELKRWEIRSKQEKLAKENAIKEETETLEMMRKPIN